MFKLYFAILIVIGIGLVSGDPCLGQYAGGKRQHRLPEHGDRPNQHHVVRPHRASGVKRPFDSYDSLYLYRSWREMDKMSQFAEKELKLAQQLNDPYAISYAIMRQAYVYQLIDMPQMSLEFNLKGMEIAKKHGYHDLIGGGAKALILLAEEHMNINRLHELIEFLMPYIDHENSVVKCEANKFIAEAYLVIHDLYNILGDSVQAKKSLKTGLQFSSCTFHPESDHSRVSITVDLLVKAGRCDEALPELLSRLKPRLRGRPGPQRSSFAHMICQCYIQKNKLDSAEIFANELNHLFKADSSLKRSQFKSQVASTLSTLYGKLGNRSLQLYYSDLESQLLKKSLLYKSMTTTHEYSIKYQAEERKKQLRAQKLENEKQNRFIILLLVGVFAATLIISLLVRINLNRKISNLNLSIKNQEISRQASQLEELSKFKEGLSGMIVHDLKTPLSAIIDLSQKESTPKNTMSIIHEAGKKMLNMVLNILDVQKFEETSVKLNRSLVNISELINQYMEELSLQLKEKNIRIVKKIAHDYIINIDVDLMGRVLMNLLANAIKYSDHNKKILITAEPDEKNQIIIKVTDEGQGIPQDQLPYIFDKFWQHRSKKMKGIRSVGLGLTFCKMVVEAHEGTIGAHSELGIGTEIFFKLPFSEKASPLEGKGADYQSNEDHGLKLTTESIALLKPYANRMDKFNVYELMDVSAILDEIEVVNEEVEAWKAEIERTIVVSNQDHYQELIKMVLA